jgi:hypothetical protein
MLPVVPPPLVLMDAARSRVRHDGAVFTAAAVAVAALAGAPSMRRLRAVIAQRRGEEAMVPS